MDERPQIDAAAADPAFLLTAAESAALANVPDEHGSAHELARLPAAPVEPQAYQLPAFDLLEAGAPGDENLMPEAGLLDVQIELGRAALPRVEADRLEAGAILTLDKYTHDPVDILADGRLVARGEVLVLNDKLCVRVAEVLSGSAGD